MTRVVITGAGFAGLSAARVLRTEALGFEVILFDRRDTFDFLPMLPDVIGRAISHRALSCNLNDLSKRLSFKFVNAEVVSLDLAQKHVATQNGSASFDYLIIASGSETNFYGNENIKKYAYALNNASDASQLTQALEQGDRDNYIICGAGYTGIEAATGLHKFLSRHKKPGKVIIVERASSILGPLPEWMKAYTLNNLGHLGIEVILNASVAAIEENRVRLTNGTIFDKAMTIWAAGVKTSNFVQNLNIEKNPQGRLKADEYLRINDYCFVCGDAAYFQYKNSYLRMAVQFALSQGQCAGRNVIKSALKKPLLKYRPLDLGYIIPMANNRACGIALGLKVK